MPVPNERHPGLRVLLAGFAAVFFVGCATVDVASRHTGPPPLCELHHVAMAPEFVSVGPGEVVYLPDYRKIARTRFPHHGGNFLRGEHDFGSLVAWKARDFVCPECTRVYQEFWRKPDFHLSSGQ